MTGKQLRKAMMILQTGKVIPLWTYTLQGWVIIGVLDPAEVG